MKKRMLVGGAILGMFIISGVTADYIKRNYASTIYQALKFSGVDTKEIIHQQEEKNHIDIFLADDADLILKIVQIKEKNKRKNYEIIQTKRMEDLFSVEEPQGIASDRKTIKNQLEMLTSFDATMSPFEHDLHQSFGSPLFFIGTTQNKKIKNLRINGQKPTNIFSHRYRGIINYVYYYEALKLDDEEIKVSL